MSVVAPCAFYGCGCWQCWHMAPLAQANIFQQGLSMNAQIKRLLLELKPLEEKQWEAQQFIQSCTEQDAKSFLQAILKQTMPIRWMHVLGVQMLGELLRVHPSVVAAHPFRQAEISWLFPKQGEVDDAAAFLYNLLWTKEAMGKTTEAETSYYTELLKKRTQERDLRKVPACSARAWLVQIWKDVPSSRPRRDLLVACCVRWIADPYAPTSGKLPLVQMVQEEAWRCSSPADAEAWTISLIFQEVCRDPMHNSPDLQQLLWFLAGPPSPATIKALLLRLSGAGSFQRKNILFEVNEHQRIYVHVSLGGRSRRSQILSPCIPFSLPLTLQVREFAWWLCGHLYASGFPSRPLAGHTCHLCMRFCVQFLWHFPNYRIAAFYATAPSGPWHP